ncbi:MAG: NADH-quinone oxidoreductase subunit L, partial [Acidiferrobacter sp.]
QSFKTGMGAAFIGRAAGLTALVGTAYFSLHATFHFMLATSFPVVRMVDGPAQFPIIGLVMLVFLAIFLVQQSLPRLVQNPWAQRTYVHLYNGLYVDIPFSRLVRKVWHIRNVPSAQQRVARP